MTTPEQRAEQAEAQVAHMMNTFFATCPKQHEHGLWCGSDWSILKWRAEKAETERDSLRAGIEALARTLELFANGRMEIYSTPPSDDAFNKGIRHAIGELRALLAGDGA